jgi:glycosyltransferase involved in cell wall biosynthesis
LLENTDIETVQSVQPQGSVAVVLPCHNEAPAIGQVIQSFKECLPNAHIVVVDNVSTDNTTEVARASGATVLSEPLRGKGNALRRAFTEIDADFYVMCDGDGTYDAARAPEMLSRLETEYLSMIVGTRDSESASMPTGHTSGNLMFNKILKILFNSTFTDVFSGYRAMTRQFVKSFPALASGFETEVELTIHAIQIKAAVSELPTRYIQRAPGTESKLRTFHDGFHILWTVFLLAKQCRPFLVYGFVSALLAALSLALGLPVVFEYIETGLVPRFPTAILATGIFLQSSLSLMAGLILHSVSRNAAETKRLYFLSLGRSRQN